MRRDHETGAFAEALNGLDQPATLAGDLADFRADPSGAMEVNDQRDFGRVIAFVVGCREVIGEIFGIEKEGFLCSGVVEFLH